MFESEIQNPAYIGKVFFGMETPLSLDCALISSSGHLWLVSSGEGKKFSFPLEAVVYTSSIVKSQRREKMQPGLVALDIDGTVVGAHHHLPSHTANYFRALHKKGWSLAFITGRSFGWAQALLKELSIPYFIGAQNGAMILRGRDEKVIQKHFVSRSTFPLMDRICQEEATDYVLYRGWEHGDRCYYRPHEFSAEMGTFLEKRREAFGEQWDPVPTYGEVSQESFASLKCFGDEAAAHRIAMKMEREIGLHCPVIEDPFLRTSYVVQGTHPKVNKGQAMKEISAFLNLEGPMICAGDDRNDLPMFEQADVAIAMGGACEEVRSRGDIQAPSVEEEGVIWGLEQALARLQFPLVKGDGS